MCHHSGGHAAAPGVTVRLQYRHKGSTGAFATFATSAVRSSTGAVSFRTDNPAYNVEIRPASRNGRGVPPGGVGPAHDRGVHLPQHVRLPGTYEHRPGGAGDLTGR